MFWLWLIVALLLIAIGSYNLGRYAPDGDEVGIFWIIIISSLLWPPLLLGVIAIGPFFGLYWLGDRRRRQLEEAAKETNK